MPTATKTIDSTPTPFFFAPTPDNFTHIRGTIPDGIEMRCGACRCQCICNCPTVCRNCRHHVDSTFLHTFAAR